MAIFLIADSLQAKEKIVECKIPAISQLSASQAKKLLVEAIKNLREAKPDSVREVKINRLGISFVADNIDERWSGACSLRYAEQTALTLVSDTKRTWFEVRSNGKPVAFRLNFDAYFTREKDAVGFINAVLNLQELARGPDTEAADYMAFTAAVKNWLAVSPKPEMPDEARALKALAEDAFKRKDYDAALEAYCDGLEKYPMWPEGNYNAALLAAETRDYELAAHHMHRYLVLAPDAPDASAAKDKFLLWQLKAKQ